MVQEDVREQLAIQRTRLAEERTALSYIRTGFTLVLGGIFFIGYFLPGTLFSYVGYGTIIVSVLFVLYGFYHHRKSMDVINRIISLPGRGVYKARTVGERIIWSHAKEENGNCKKCEEKGNGKK